MRDLRSSGTLLRAAALAAALGGCQPGVTPAEGEAEPAAPPPPVVVGPGPTASSEAMTPLASYRRGVPESGVATSATALLTGTLALRDGCLVIDVDGGPTVQPVFPAGDARWDEAARRLAFGGAGYGLGDAVAVGGGGVTSDDAVEMDGPRCEGADLFVVS